jgi:hypothetical protein
MTYSCLNELYLTAPGTTASFHVASLERKTHELEARPFRPRNLTLQERRDEDLHAFASPKEKDRVEVVGVPALCLGLLLEFNPNIAAYTQRPRLLLTSTERHELAFWIRDLQGRERFLFIVATKDSIPEKGGKRAHRRMEVLQEAARRLEIQLIFISEPELMEQRMRITQALRMLPYVQDAQRLGHRLYLQDRVTGFFELNRQARFMDVESSLPDFIASDVRAVVCDLIHQGALNVDADASLNMRSVVKLGGHHD